MSEPLDNVASFILYLCTEGSRQREAPRIGCRPPHRLGRPALRRRLDPVGIDDG